jgi:hypothetical protein
MQALKWEDALFLLEKSRVMYIGTSSGGATFSIGTK